MNMVKKKEMFALKNMHQHPFHLVNHSIWPACVAFGLLNFFLSFLGYFNTFFMISVTTNLEYTEWTLYSPVFYFLILGFFFKSWFVDIMSESTYEGFHTLSVQNGIYFGMILFILSEMMFFFSFFWAFFHISLSPNMYLGLMWPPKYLNLLDPYSLPMWNTFILLSSGVTVTLAHSGTLAGSSFCGLEGLSWTLFYGVFFTLMQGYEYCYSPFSMNDGIFGSLFFLLTGFHGLHVIMGSIFMFVCFTRLMDYEYTRQHHVGLESGMMYWHMVDIMWLFLYFCVYIQF